MMAVKLSISDASSSKHPQTCGKKQICEKDTSIPQTPQISLIIKRKIVASRETSVPTASIPENP